MPLGLRTKFKITDTKSVEVYRKSWSIPIPSQDKLKYIVVLNDNGNYSLIDDESLGFDTFGGAEQFARVYIKGEFDLESTRTTINLKLESGLRYDPLTGEYIER